MKRAVVLGAREGSGNIGDAIVQELSAYYRLGHHEWVAYAEDCQIGDGSRPPGGNLPSWGVAEQHGYHQTEKGWYARYDVPSVDQFKRWAADALVVTLGSTYKDPFWEVQQYVFDRVIRASLLLPLEAARRFVQAAEILDRSSEEASKADPEPSYPYKPLRHIVFIGSYAHRHPFTNGTAYCVAKAGIDMAARALGWELTDRGYRVHVVHPWHVKGTPMWSAVEQGVMESKGWTKEQADAYADRDLKMPEGLSPEEVAAIVRMLLTEPAAEWLSGTSLELNGGTR